MLNYKLCCKQGFLFLRNKVKAEYVYATPVVRRCTASRLLLYFLMPTQWMLVDYWQVLSIMGNTMDPVVLVYHKRFNFTAIARAW